MNKKICSNCKQELPLTEFHISKAYGHQSWCKRCKAEHKRAYGKTPEGKRSQRKTYEKLRDSGYFQKYNSRQDKTKKVAQNLVTRLQQIGTIEKQPCIICGKEYGEAHHSDYTQPLLIVWLCHNCHMGLHNTIKGDRWKIRDCALTVPLNY